MEIEVSCKHCNITFKVRFLSSAKKRKYCSLQCSSYYGSLGKIPWNKGIKCSEETKLKISIANTGKTGLRTEEGNARFREKMCGENHPNWIKDRSLIKLGDRNLHDPLYKQWRTSVLKRDNNSCRIADNNCDGRMETHHILIWRDYPELRYEINNGITLCHAHHPKKRAEEKRLESYFMELVSVSN